MVPPSSEPQVLCGIHPGYVSTQEGKQSSCPASLVPLQDGVGACSRGSAFLLGREDGQPEHLPLPVPKKPLPEQWDTANLHTPCPRHGPWPRARGTVLPGASLAAQPFPAGLSVWGRNALGSHEDKIKSLLGVTRQRSRKRDGTVCFLGDLFGFFFNFIFFYFWQLKRQQGGSKWPCSSPDAFVAFKRQKWPEFESLCAAKGMSHSRAVVGRGEGVAVNPAGCWDGGAGCWDGGEGMREEDAGMEEKCWKSGNAGTEELGAGMEEQDTRMEKQDVVMEEQGWKSRMLEWRREVLG